MVDQPQLSRADWTIVVELLEREQSELHPEIRHTRSRGLREQLHERLKLVQALLEKLRSLAEPVEE